MEPPVFIEECISAGQACAGACINNNHTTKKDMRYRESTGCRLEARGSQTHFLKGFFEIS